MHRAQSLVALVVLGATWPVMAEQRPDLSGAWVATTDAPVGVAAAPTPVMGPKFAIRQAGDTFALIRPVRDTSMTALLTLDGRETRTRIPGRLCEAEPETVETVAWEDNAVVLTVVGSVPPGGGTEMKLNVRRLFRLQGADTLIVEASTRTAADAAPRPVATVYKRSGDAVPPPRPVDMVPSRAGRAPGTIAQIAWIAGVWVGTTDKSVVEERWTPAAGGSMLGVGRTLRNGVMSAFEFLCIAERDGGLVYMAMPNGRTPATDFTATAVTADSVTFENPAHDFPKLIRYTRRPDGTLETAVSGGPKQREQVVVLKREEK
jgi:hypothetical protein